MLRLTTVARPEGCGDRIQDAEAWPRELRRATLHVSVAEGKRATYGRIGLEAEAILLRESVADRELEDLVAQAPVVRHHDDAARARRRIRHHPQSCLTIVHGGYLEYLEVKIR